MCIVQAANAYGTIYILMSILEDTKVKQLHLNIKLNWNCIVKCD